MSNHWIFSVYSLWLLDFEFANIAEKIHAGYSFFLQKLQPSYPQKVIKISFYCLNGSPHGWGTSCFYSYLWIYVSIKGYRSSDFCRFILLPVATMSICVKNLHLDVRFPTQYIWSLFYFFLLSVPFRIVVLRKVFLYFVPH